MSCGCLASRGITIIIKLLPELKWGFVAFSGGQYHRICSISLIGVWKLLIIPPCFNEVERGVYWFHHVCLSVCPSLCPSLDRIVSALYLQQYLLDPFHIYTSYQAISEAVSHVKFVSKFKEIGNFGKFFKFVTLTLSSFDIQYDSKVWVIMRRQGVSSEHRRSSCSLRWQQQLPVANELMGNCHGDKTRCSYEQLLSLPLIIALVHDFMCVHVIFALDTQVGPLSLRLCKCSPQILQVGNLQTWYGLTQCGLEASDILVDIGSGNGLLPDGTKPLPEPMLTLNYQQGPLAFIPV